MSNASVSRFSSPSSTGKQDGFSGIPKDNKCARGGQDKITIISAHLSFSRFCWPISPLARPTISIDHLSPSAALQWVGPPPPLGPLAPGRDLAAHQWEKMGKQVQNYKDKADDGQWIIVCNASQLLCLQFMSFERRGQVAASVCSCCCLCLAAFS